MLLSTGWINVDVRAATNGEEGSFGTYGRAGALRICGNSKFAYLWQRPQNTYEAKRDRTKRRRHEQWRIPTHLAQHTAEETNGQREWGRSEQCDGSDDRRTGWRQRRCLPGPGHISKTDQAQSRTSSLNHVQVGFWLSGVKPQINETIVRKIPTAFKLPGRTQISTLVRKEIGLRWKNTLDWITINK